MPFLPGITDDETGIRNLYAELCSIGVDFIMPGGLTLRPGRQKDLYLQTLAAYRPELLESTQALYREDRPSGRPYAQAENGLFEKFSRIQQEFNIPFLLPHTVFSKALPSYDSFRILLRDMIELYDARGVDIRPLRKSADLYDAWLIGLRRVFRRRRSLPTGWLLERFQNAIETEELFKVLANPRLARFAEKILKSGAVFDYTTLKLLPAY